MTSQQINNRADVLLVQAGCTVDGRREGEVDPNQTWFEYTMPTVSTMDLSRMTWRGYNSKD